MDIIRLPFLKTFWFHYMVIKCFCPANSSIIRSPPEGKGFALALVFGLFKSHRNKETPKCQANKGLDILFALRYTSIQTSIGGMAVGYQTKVQHIKREKSEQWYIGLPAQLAQAMEFKQSETVEWFVEDKSTLALKRHNAPDLILKKKHKE